MLVTRELVQRCTRHSAAIAAVNNTINAHLEPDEDSALADVRDHSGIFVLNFAFIETGFAGVAIYTLSQEYNDGVVVEDVWVILCLRH